MASSYISSFSLYRSRYGRQPSASRKRPALQGLPHPASGIFNRFEYMMGRRLQLTENQVHLVASFYKCGRIVSST